jgi:protein ImuB
MRDTRQEELTLKRLASWAETFTSFVVIEAPTTLLLEIAGSLRLFAGLRTLRQRITRDCREQGFSTRLAIAPTPQASFWLAKAGRAVCIEDSAHLNSALSALPLHGLGWPHSVTEALAGMGITRVGDCLRLPRAGFVRRFGAARLRQLDRALGRLPDPRVSYRSPERFCATQDLDEEQSDRELLLQVCRQLLLQLERFLVLRQMQVQRVQFSFFHLRAGATCMVLGSAQAGRNASHWAELLAIKFERMILPEAVISICLRGGRCQLSSIATDNLLFDASKSFRDGSIATLVERLNTRIGEASVRGVAAVAEHRPQYAWRSSSVSAVAAAHMAPVACDSQYPMSLELRRPLWMLEPPQRLASEDARPLYQGTLTLMEGPERLESGWWDDDGIARDYFVALTMKGVLLWVYQDRQQKSLCWYLHGIFG